jgi:hypothetical protein
VDQDKVALALQLGQPPVGQRDLGGPGAYLRNPPLAEMSEQELTSWLRPVIAFYLTEPGEAAS